MDRLGNRPVESSAWIERMVWRTAFLILFVLGLICFVGSGGDLIYLALVAGGLFPGLFLMAREQGERHIEAQRRALLPEGRYDELPEVGARRPSDPHPTPPYGTDLRGLSPYDREQLGRPVAPPTGLPDRYPDDDVADGR